MKKLLFSAILAWASFFISCRDSSTTEANAGSTSQAAINTANSNKVYRGIESGDLSKMDDFVAADVIDHGGGMGEVKGLDSVKKMLGDIHNHFSNLKFELVASGTDGDYHFALVRMTGTTKDAMMGMPANTPVDRRSIDLVKLVDGKVKDHWMFVDPKEMMKMMGNAPSDSKMNK